MKVLVTGGAGYIGSHACKTLAQGGHEPVALDDLSMGHEWAVKWGPLVVADLADQAALEKALREHRIEAVIHFAGNAYVGESMRDPVKYFLNNMAATARLLDSMIRCGVSRVVFSSSCAVYGLPEKTPIDEGCPAIPVNPYGESKLAIERMLRWLGELKGLRWIALRYFNAAGADPEGEIGEDHDPETHLVPLALRAAAPGDYRLRVFGTDYPTPDGTAIRDYVHVADLAEAHVLALKALDASPVNEAVNLGTGRGASVMQVISAVEAVTGLKVRYEASSRRAGDAPELVADAAKARALLSWKPRRSGLDTVVADAWRWYRKGRRGSGAPRGSQKV